ncbi:MAG TPA: winged helix-turn-helix domain-containing protein, partial [Steroidobacteraceae bacterium]|nr:winged helix-turn-helix domain-containing protein [Steroidobacteraceae bacterium]
MKAIESSSLRIGAWRVDPMLGQMSKDDNTVKLERRAMQLLLCLAEHAGQVVSVEQLLDQVWTGVVVTPDSVYHAVAALRRMLGDDSHDPTYIANVPRRGYRLVAPVAAWVDPTSITGGSSADPAAATATDIATTTGTLFGRYRTLLSIALAAALILALGYFAADKYWLSRQVTAEHGTLTTTIAVLPFVDLSEKKDQEYFADGMAEEILDLLAKNASLKVIGRTSSFQFKGKNEDIRKIGAELGVAYVLEGSVRRSGDRVRVTAQLISTDTGAHQWSETYDHPIGDVLKMEDEIAGSLVRALQIAVAADRLQSRPTLGNSEAYDLYLRGRYAQDRQDKESLEEAARYFLQALSLDPTFADASAMLALVYYLQG